MHHRNHGAFVASSSQPFIPFEALRLSQQAPSVLQTLPSSVSSSPLSALFSAKETPDIWVKYENLLLSCLRTGDERTAHQCLGRLVTRFGDKNERILALKGLMKEADAQDNAALEEILKEYDGILSSDDTNIVCYPWAATKRGGMMLIDHSL